MRKDLEKVIDLMNKAVRNDVSVELYGWHVEKETPADNFVTLNVYNLNDIYSTQYTLHFDREYFYHSDSYSITKFRTDLAKKLLSVIKEYLNNRGKWSIIEKIFDHYKTIFDTVYNVKYSLTANSKLMDIIKQ